jgi:hypothetical protein
MSDERWVGAHRSLDGAELHPGFVDECIECADGFERGELVTPYTEQETTK